MKLDFKLDWKVILEFEPNDFILYVTLLGIEYNVLLQKAQEYNCNVGVFTAYARDRYLVNILRFQVRGIDLG